MSQPFFDPSRETLSPEERDSFQVSALWDLLAYAWANCPSIKARMNAAGLRPEDVKGLEDLRRIPVTTKDELRQLQQKDPPFGGFLGVPLQELSAVFCSPGPIYEPQDTSEAFWKRLEKCIFNAGIGKGDVVLCTLSYHMVPAGLWLQGAAQRLGATVVPAGPGNTELQVRIMHDLGVTAYVGTPSFLYTIITRAEEMGYDFRRDFRLRKALATAEMLSPSMRTVLQGYGVEVFQAYGSADLGLLAYECGNRDGFHVCEETILELLDPATREPVQTGNAGEVVVTTLDVRIYPWVRFSTGDLALYTDEPCSCGRTSRKLARIVGRVGEAAKVRGMFLHPKQVEEVVSRFPAVSNWSIRVTRPAHRDEIVLVLEVASSEGPGREAGDKICELLPQMCHVRPDSVQFLPPGTLVEAERKKVVDRREWK